MLEWEWLWLALLGLGTGIYGVLVGAGGGFILGPVLILFFGMSPKIVAGTSLGLVAINSISGAIAYWRLGLVDKRSGLLFAAAALPGSVIAPFFLAKMNSGTFQILFGILLLTLTVQMLVRSKIPNAVEAVSVDDKKRGKLGSMIRVRDFSDRRGTRYRYRFNELWATSFNIILGFISSFFGTGGGFLRTPILINVFAFPVQIAVATSIFALSIYTSAGVVSHIIKGNVDWFPTFLFTGIGLVIGGQIGAKLTKRVKGAWILRLLTVVVFVLGAQLIIQGIRS